MIDNLARYARILRRYVVIGVVRKSQYRLEFAAQVGMDCLWYTLHVLVFELLFEHTDAIAGWERGDVRVFLGFMFVSDAFMMTFLGATWSFSRALKDGKLDPFRVRPAATWFLFFFQSFALEGLVNLSIAATYTLVTIHWAVGLGHVATWLLLLWGVVLACWTRGALLLAYSIVEFHFLNSDLAAFLDNMFDTVSERPLDVFGARLKFLFVFAVPVGLMTYVPAALVLGKMSLALGAGITAFLAAFTWLVIRLWNRGMRQYESAMS